MIRIEMHFYATRTPDGLIHVQNVIDGLLGQHHIHNEQSFERWRKDVPDAILTIDEGACDCGLDTPGQIREYDGHVWFNDRFLKESNEEVNG